MNMIMCLCVTCGVLALSSVCHSARSWHTTDQTSISRCLDGYFLTSLYKGAFYWVNQVGQIKFRLLTLLPDSLEHSIRQLKVGPKFEWEQNDWAWRQSAPMCPWVELLLGVT